MGIRRRRKKLTTVLTSVDRRLRSVESRVVPTRIAASAITAADIAPDVIPPSDPRDSGGTGSTSSENAPSQFSIVSAAAYSAKNITGSDDWIDITTTQPHGLVVGDKVTAYGLNNSDVNASGTYTITEVGSTTTFRYKVGLTGYYPSVVNLAVSATVTQRSCTLTEATLVLNSSTHGFVVGNVITVAGVDDTFNGTFFVSSVNGATIKYKFITAAASAVSITSSSGTVHSVVHKYAIIGDTWIDTSVTPSAYKIWDGLSWQSGTSLPDGVIVDDHMAPKAPTNLSALTSGYYNPTSGQPAVAVTLSWDAPTLNADETPLTDLAGYKVFYRYTNESLDGTENGSVGYEPAGQTTTPGSPASSDAKVSGTFTWNNTFTSTVPAISLSTSAGTLTITAIAAIKGKKSANWEVTGLADDDAFTVSWASSSSNKYGYGSVSGTIGSETYTTVNNPATTGFSISGAIKATSQTRSSASATPEVTTDIPSTAEAAPVIQWIGAGDTNQTSMSLRDFNVASTIEFAVQAYDSSKMNYSVYSDVLSIDTGSPAIILAAPSIPTLEARLGTLTVKWDGYDEDGFQPPPYLAYTEVHLGTSAGFTPSIGTLKGRLERLGYNELIVANLTYGTTYYAKLIFVSTTGATTQSSDASTGVAVVALVDTDVIGKVISGAKIVDGSITASDAIIGNTITGNLIQSNTIEAGSIKTNSLTADQIQAGALDAFLITGSSIQTAKPLAEGGQNARITINSSGITAYNSSGTSTFTIDANTGTVTVGGYVPAGGSASDINSGTTTISGGKITSGTITATQISSSYVYAGYIDAEKINAGTITGVSISGGSLSTTGSTYVSISGTSVTFNYSGSSVGSMTGSYNASSGKNGIIVTTNLFAVLGELGVYDSTFNLSNSLMYSASAGNYLVDAAGEIHGARYWALGTSEGWHRSAADGSNYFQASAAYTRTYTQAVNCYITTNGVIGRSTSASKYKLLIEEKTGYNFENILNLKPKTWFDKNAVEARSDWYTSQYNGQESIEPIDSEPIERVSGLIAEDLLDAGLEDYIIWGSYKEDGTREVEGIQYDRLWTCLIPVVKELRDRINQLEGN